MRRIAFPTSDRVTIDGHFGHTKEFAIVSIKDNKVVSEDFITPPPHKTGVLPVFLSDSNVNTIISGGMGAKAIALFKHKDIEVILGVNGLIQEALQSYLKGSLESKGSSCNHQHGEHEHKHEHKHKEGCKGNHDHDDDHECRNTKK